MESKIKDLFDLNNLEDLPEELGKELAYLRSRQNTKKLLSLFDIKNQLSVDEMLVGMVRKYGVKKERSWFLSTISNLKHRKIIKQVDGKKKVYEII